MELKNNNGSFDEVLLQGALFMNTTHSTSMRVGLFGYLLKKALFNLQNKGDTKIDFESIVIEVSKTINPNITYNYDDNIPKDYLIEALNECISNDEIIEEGQLYLLTDNAYDNIKVNINKAAQQKEGILQYFLNEINDIVTIEGDTAKNFLKEEILKFIYGIVDMQCVYVAQAIDAKSGIAKTLCTNKSSEKAIELEENLKMSLMNFFENESLKVAIILDTIIKAFYEMPRDILDYINTIFNNLLYNKILRVDPKLKAFQDNLLVERIIYLDDNVVLSAILTSHPSHAIVKEVLHDCKKLGIKMRITPEVLEEVNAIFKYSHSVMQDTTIPISEKFKNGIVKEFYTYKLHDWEDFLRYYLPIENIFCKEFNVECSVEMYDKENCLLQDDYSKIFNIFKENKDNKRFSNDMNEAGEKTINHDVVNFMTAHKLMQKYPADILGQKIIFVSLDTCLRSNQIRLQRDYPVFYSKHILEFMRFILPYKVNLLNDMNQQEYINYLINNDLGNFESDEETDILTLIQNNNIEMSKLLVMEPAAAQEIVTALNLRNDYNEINEYLSKIREVKEISDNPIMSRILMEIERKNEIHNLELFKKNEAIKKLSRENEILSENLFEMNKTMSKSLLELKKEHKAQRVYMYSGMALILIIISILQIITLIKK
jgi:hypothetical protein